MCAWYLIFVVTSFPPPPPPPQKSDFCPMPFTSTEIIHIALLMRLDSAQRSTDISLWHNGGPRPCARLPSSSPAGSSLGAGFRIQKFWACPICKQPSADVVCNTILLVQALRRDLVPLAAAAVRWRVTVRSVQWLRYQGGKVRLSLACSLGALVGSEWLQRMRMLCG